MSRRCDREQKRQNKNKLERTLIRRVGDNSLVQFSSGLADVSACRPAKTTTMTTSTAGRRKWPSSRGERGKQVAPSPPSSSSSRWGWAAAHPHRWRDYSIAANLRLLAGRQAGNLSLAEATGRLRVTKTKWKNINCSSERGHCHCHCRRHCRRRRRRRHPSVANSPGLLCGLV
jgi:hypothetical protein